MNKDKNTGEDLPKRFTISSELLNHALGFLAMLPVYQSMELITRINMDIVAVPDEKDTGSINQGMKDPMMDTNPKPEPKTVKLNPNK